MTIKVKAEDFEVLPRGTTSELIRLRQFFNIVQNYADDGEAPDSINEAVESMEKFYEGHIERYPL